MPRNLLPVAGLALACLLGSLPAAAQQRGAEPRRLGAHGAWTAAVHQEGGQRVCYAFARAGGTQARQNVTLTVAHRPNGRDQVAVSVAQALPRGAEAVLAIGTQEFRSYGVVQSSAFFASNAQLIAALRGGRDAVVRSPGPGGRGTVSDSFPLSGFSAAYEAIGRECPAQTQRSSR